MSKVAFKELDAREADGVAREVEWKLGGKSAEEVEGVGFGPA